MKRMNTELRCLAVRFAVSVVDPHGAVVSGAHVKARNVKTGVVFTTTSDKSGNFRLNLLPMGTYDVEIIAKGFKTSSKTVFLNVPTKVEFFSAQRIDVTFSPN